MIEFIQSIFGNWADIVVGFTAIVTAASVIVKLTPTTADDKVLGLVQKALKTVALNKGVK